MSSYWRSAEGLGGAAGGPEKTEPGPAAEGSEEEVAGGGPRGSLWRPGRAWAEGGGEALPWVGVGRGGKTEGGELSRAVRPCLARPLGRLLPLLALALLPLALRWLPNPAPAGRGEEAAPHVLAKGLLFLQDYLTLPPSGAGSSRGAETGRGSPGAEAQGREGLGGGGEAPKAAAEGAPRKGRWLSHPERSSPGVYQFVELLVGTGSVRAEGGWWVAACAKLLSGSGGAPPSRGGRCLAVYLDDLGETEAVADLGVFPARPVGAEGGFWEPGGEEGRERLQAHLGEGWEDAEIAGVYLSGKGTLLGQVRFRQAGVGYLELVCRTGEGAPCLPLSLPAGGETQPRPPHLPSGVS